MKRARCLLKLRCVHGVTGSFGVSLAFALFSAIFIFDLYLQEGEIMATGRVMYGEQLQSSDGTWGF